jgi:hypothetical protein
MVLSTPHFWIPAFESRDTLRPGGMLSSSVLDIYLMSMWYDLEVHESTHAIYIDSHTAGAFDYDIDMDTFISSYRQRYFLPSTGPCEDQAIIFMVVHSNRFLACFMDTTRSTLYLLATDQEDEKWEEWHGPHYYRHICRLNGWTSDDASQVEIVRVQANFSDPAHCSIMALSLAMHIMQKGLDGDGSLRIHLPQDVSISSERRCSNIFWGLCEIHISAMAFYTTIHLRNGLPGANVMLMKLYSPIDTWICREVTT